MANAEIGTETNHGAVPHAFSDALLAEFVEIAWVGGTDGSLEWIHPAARNIYGCDVDELIGQVLRGRASKMCGPLAPANVDFASLSVALQAVRRLVATEA